MEKQVMAWLEREMRHLRHVRHANDLSHQIASHFILLHPLPPSGGQSLPSVLRHSHVLACVIAIDFDVESLSVV
jgi:hypothetical protein